MTSSVPRKAIVSLSSFNGAIFPDGSKTGVFFTEAFHPFQVFTEAGFDVDFASETGTYDYDEFSLLPPFLAGSDKAVHDNADHPFMVKMATGVRKASEVDPSDYGLFFASAGHAALYDYPDARSLQAVAAAVWNRGGILGAVCHGPVLLPGVVDATTGKSVVDGKTVTGFTVEGEMLLGVLDQLNKDKVTPVADAVYAAGAEYSSPIGAFDDYSITAGRLVTGTNPASARSTAERAVMAFASLGQEYPWLRR